MEKTERVGILTAIKALFGSNFEEDVLNKSEEEEVKKLIKETEELRKLEDSLLINNNNKNFSPELKVGLKKNKHIKETKNDSNEIQANTKER